MQFIDNKEYLISDGYSTIRCVYDEASDSFVPVMSYFRGYYDLQKIRAEVVVLDSNCLEVTEVE